MTSRVRPSFTCAVLAAALLAAACHQSGTPDANAPSGTATLPSSPTALPTMTYDQFTAMLKTLEGKPVVVNFWASWCGPCRAEAPGLAQVSRRFAGKVQFVGVDVADQPAAARAYIGKYGWIYPSVADPRYEIRRGFGLLGQPDTILFDASGKQVWEAPGAVTAATLQGQLQRLIG